MPQARRLRKKRTPAQIEVRALKDAAKREVEAEIERIAKINRDRMAEVLNESLSPAIMRQSITAPGGRVLTGPRVQIVAGRAVRTFDPSLSYSEAQMRAARRIKGDWDAVGTGVNACAVDMARCGSGGEGGGHAAMLAQVMMRQSLEAALTHLGGFVAVVRRIILHCVPVSDWLGEWNEWRASRKPVQQPASLAEAVAFLGLALKRLASHYEPERPARPRILTIGPKRESYDMIVCPSL